MSYTVGKVYCTYIHVSPPYFIYTPFSFYIGILHSSNLIYFIFRIEQQCLAVIFFLFSVPSVVSFFIFFLNSTSNTFSVRCFFFRRITSNLFQLVWYLSCSKFCIDISDINFQVRQQIRCFNIVHYKHEAYRTNRFFFPPWGSFKGT